MRAEALGSGAPGFDAPRAPHFGERDAKRLRLSPEPRLGRHARRLSACCESLTTWSGTPA